MSTMRTVVTTIMTKAKCARLGLIPLLRGSIEAKRKERDCQSVV